jgi:hypothetical protein
VNPTGGIVRPLTASQVLARLNANATIALTAPVTSSSTLTVTNATDASDSATAAVVTSGGVAMAKNLWVGANAAAGIALTLNCAAANGGLVKYTAANTLRWQHGRVGTTHDWRIEGYDSSGVLTDIPMTIANAAGGAFTIVRPVSITSSAVSSSTSTGALIVTGGVGIGGKAWIGGTINVAGASTFAAVAATALTVDNGNTTNQLTLGNGTNGFCAIVMRNGSTHYAWAIGAQYNLSETLEFIPSSAVGGTNFSASGNVSVLSLTQAGDVVLGTRAALATAATGGFGYMPTCAGTPTGVPTGYTGKVAWVYDTTNNKLCVYNGAWKQTAALT